MTLAALESADLIKQLRAENAQLLAQNAVLLGGRPQPLTAKQRAFFDMLHATIERQGFAPSIEEMATARGLSSTGGVHEYLVILERKGWIHRSRGAGRGITILARP
jgi:hypothetical protein